MATLKDSDETTKAEFFARLNNSTDDAIQFAHSRGYAVTEADFDWRPVLEYKRLERENAFVAAQYASERPSLYSLVELGKKTGVLR